MPLTLNLDIVNAACARIGADAIQSMDDDISEVQSAELIYSEVVGLCLGLYQFSWSKQLRQLSIDDSATPLTGYTTVFDLPPERLGNPLYITDNASDPDRRFSRYALVGTQVHSDATALVAMIRFVPNPVQWSPPFAAAVVAALGSRFAIAMGHDRNLAGDLYVEAFGTPSEMMMGGLFGAAKRDDAYTTPIRRRNVFDNPLENARY